MRGSDKGSLKQQLMACMHRFHDKLIPDYHVEYLFIGTFNPAWDYYKKNEGGKYFYSRPSSTFWCILPHALNQQCIIDKSESEKVEFAYKHKIGFSDIIKCVENADENNEQHRKVLAKGFKDENFGIVDANNFQFRLQFVTEDLKNYLLREREHIRGVFFTRKTNKDIVTIWGEWIKIKDHCRMLNLHAAELSSPSPRGGNIVTKINEWRYEISKVSMP